MTATVPLATHSPEVHNGVSTSWLPMSTPWPSSQGCQNSLWQWVSPTLAAWDPGYGVYVEPGFHCHPPQVTSWWDAAHLSSIDLAKTQISLGPVVCPAAYFTATTSVNDASSTFVACCPSGYEFVAVHDVGNTGECVSKLHDGQVVSFATSVASAAGWSTTTLTISAESYAFGIPVNGWLFPGGHNTTSSSPSSSATTSQPANTSQPTLDDKTGNTGLSTGAKAGIGIGVALGVICVAAVVAAVIFRRRKRKDSTKSAALPEMEGMAKTDAAQPPRAEVYGSSLAEVEGSQWTPPEQRLATELP